MNSLWIPLILCSIILTEGSNGSQCFDKSTDVDSCQTVSIKCPNGSVIYSPVVKASSEPCNSKHRGCVGIPFDLVVDINQCYWKQSCTIKFPSTYIFTETCVREVRSLQVNSWRCVKTQGTNGNYFIESMCTGNKNIGTNASFGILLSHQSIPWNYDRKDFSSVSKRTPTKRCTKTIHMKFHKKEIIMLTMDRFDIDLDNDQLFINDNLILKKENVVSSNTVSIKFTSNIIFSKGGTGFVICYKKIRQGDKSTSACDAIMETHTDTASTSEICKNVLPNNQKCNLKETGGMNVTNRNEQTQTSVKINNKCKRCLENKKQIDRCELKCCQQVSKHPQCPNKDLNSKDSSKDIPTILTSVPPSTCKLNKRKIKHRCKSCKTDIPKCIKKKNRQSCLDCCPGKDILPTCKPRNNKARNGQRKGKRNKSKKSKTSRSKTNKKS